MNELGLDRTQIAPSFSLSDQPTYQLVTVSEEHAAMWSNVLCVAVRRCYVTDRLLDDRARMLTVPKLAILSARLPDPGSTMAGDFGEILVYVYHATADYPKVAFGPKKWRLKQDRTKSAPYSDVVHIVLPRWPEPSEEDEILCSEVKTKSTAGASSPITEAINDCAKDRTSRLARTLVWLRERALVENLGDVTLDQLTRFINSIDYPKARKRFYAVAVVCSSLLEAELVNAPAEPATEYKLIVIAVPNLREIYTGIFDSVRRSVVAPITDVGGAR